MATALKKRKATSSIKIDPNVRCLRIYPVEDNRNSTKTIAHRRPWASNCRASRRFILLACSWPLRQEWDEMDITAWRVYKRQSDGT